MSDARAGQPAPAQRPGRRRRARHRVLHAGARPGRPRPAGRVRHLAATAGRASTPPSTRRTSSPPRRRSASTGPQQGYDGPLFIGRDTHALSEPAWATALEVLAANDVTVLVDAADRYTPTPAVSHAILRANAGQDPAASPTASSSPRRTTRPATAASSTTRRTAARPTPTPPAGSPTGPTTCCAPGSSGVRRVPLDQARAAAEALRLPRRPTSTTCPRVRRPRRHPERRRAHRRRPAGRRQRRLLGGDRRAAPARPHRGEPAGRPHLAVHDAGLGRQDPDGLLVAVGHGLAGRPKRASSRSPPATTPTPTGTASSPPTAA